MPQVYTHPRDLHRWIADRGITRLMLVGGSTAKRPPLCDWLAAIPCPVVWFDGIRPNPLYEDICRGVELFRREGCDGILAAGGGSAMDTAKAIKLWCRLDPAAGLYLHQPMTDTGVPLGAIPTTAGTGSEATRYAVLYHEGEKQSVAHESLVPDGAFLFPELLYTLPPYQKKATLLDALCQSIESTWAVKANGESTAFASASIRGILTHMDAYLAGDPPACGPIQQAAYDSGRAIDVTATTAAHAMGYKLTTLYGLAHGHAVGLCMRVLWPYVASHTAESVLPGGEAALKAALQRLTVLFGAENAADAARKYAALYDSLALPTPAIAEAELSVLAASVNVERLKNNPVPLSAETLYALYRAM